MKPICERRRLAGAALIAGALMLATGTSMAAGGEEWWTRSWLRETDPTNGFRTHIELSGGGESLAGNESGWKATGRAMIALRRRRLTFYEDGSYNLEDKDYGLLGSSKRTTYMARETLRWDLGEKIYTSGGLVSERDDVTFIESRQGLFCGLGYDADFGKRLQMTFYGAWGSDSVAYNTGGPIAGIYAGPQRQSDHAVILSVRAVWQVLDDVSLRPDWLYVVYTGDELKNRQEAGVALQFNVDQNLSMVLRYERRTEDNPVLEAIGGDPLNTALKWMFKISY